MESMLSNNEIAKLRQQEVISRDEIAFWTGDLCIAENVITKERRILENFKELSETKQLLKG